MIMQVNDTISHERKLIRREKVPNWSILQKLFQDNYHFICFLIIVFYGKAEQGFGKGEFGYVHNIIEHQEALLD